MVSVLTGGELVDGESAAGCFRPLSRGNTTPSQHDVEGLWERLFTVYTTVVYNPAVILYDTVLCYCDNSAILPLAHTLDGSILNICLHDWSKTWRGQPPQSHHKTT